MGRGDPNSHWELRVRFSHSHCICIIILIGLQLEATYVMEKGISALPHLRADFLANLPGIFAGPADAFHDRKSSFRIRDQEKQRTLRVEVLAAAPEARKETARNQRSSMENFAGFRVRPCVVFSAREALSALSK
jgi:hypothetical protein